MGAIEFQGWPKIPRLNRDMVITEKIDGTNAAIHIRKQEKGTPIDPAACVRFYDHLTDMTYDVAAQSRNRIINPSMDNHGFASWVQHHAMELTRRLGEGVHFGEWWGSGIQRGYGLTKGEKRFSLFNVNRYLGVSVPDIGLGVVPVLFEGDFNTAFVDNVLHYLAINGSSAARGFMNPEGIVVFHEAARSAFKVTIKNDDKPKGQGA
jgi:hypothetical protein